MSEGHGQENRWLGSLKSCLWLIPDMSELAYFPSRPLVAPLSSSSHFSFSLPRDCPVEGSGNTNRLSLPCGFSSHTPPHSHSPLLWLPPHVLIATVFFFISISSMISSPTFSPTRMFFTQLLVRCCLSVNTDLMWPISRIALFYIIKLSELVFFVFFTSY